MTTTGVLRRPIAISLICAATLLLGFGSGPARADVTAVAGGAYGYSLTASLFNGPPNQVGPTPTVTLPAAGSAPLTANAVTGSAKLGPATFFTSGPIAVSTQGTTGPTGSATSSTSIQTVNTSGEEPFTAATLSSTCTASQAGKTGSTTITGGTLLTDNGLDVNGDGDYVDAGEHAPVTVGVPANPAPNTIMTGHTHFSSSSSDQFRYVFNEQIVNPDGSITVNAVHETLLGPTAVGDLIIGQSRCGVTAPPDTTPPQTTIDSGPSGTIATGSASFAFSSSEANSTFECKLDGPGATTGTFGSCSSPKAYSSLANGSYTFSVRATDASTNTDQTPATRSFTVAVPPPDTTPPQTTIDSGPSGTIATGSASFAFSSSEANSTFECKLDGPGATTGTFGSCSSPKAYSSLANGSYTFSVRATDASTNTDQTPATRSFTVAVPPPDTTPPQTTIDSGPSGTIAVNSASFAFSSSEANSTFECKLDGPGATTGTFGSCSSPKAYSNLANGSYTFSVRATDASTNTDQTPATRSFTVAVPPADTTPPQTTIDSGPSGTITVNSASLAFSSSEANSTFECKLDGPGATTGTFGSCSSPKAYSNLANGSYTFSVRATDASTNTDQTPATRSFTVAVPAGNGHPPPAPAHDATKPLLSSLTLSPARFRAAASGPSVAASVGSTVSYRLSEPAAVTFRIERARPGRRAGGRCVKPRRSNRRGRRCTRYVTLRGRFAHQGSSGLNQFRFSGRLGGRKLAPGRYRLRAVATDPAGNVSGPRRRGFRIVRR